MTDKAQIIIDGVDVSGCAYFDYENEGTRECDAYSNECEANNCYYKQLARKTQECEELKKQLMQKSEVDMFFNTPIEGWSNDPCGTCPHKAENEELKEEILTKNEKIKELRLSVSDLTNRLCYLNAEKSFRIVDLEQALDTVSEYIKDNCNSCQGIKYGGCEKCELKRIEDIISKVNPL